MAEHPDLVEWVLGEADPEVEAHLAGCEACRRAAGELRGSNAAMRLAAPRFEVPPGLEARVLGAVAPPPRRRRRRTWVAVPALAVAAAAVFIVLAGGGAESRALRSTVGESVDVTAAVEVTPVGREVELDIRRLRDPRPGGLYELWFVSADGRRRVSAGTFHPDEHGRGTVRLLAAADPRAYPTLSVTLEPADGNPRRTGPEVLR